MPPFAAKPQQYLGSLDAPECAKLWCRLPARQLSHPGGNESITRKQPLLQTDIPAAVWECCWQGKVTCWRRLR